MTTLNSDKEAVQLKAFADARIAKSPVAFDRVSVSVNLNAKVLTEYKRELFAEWQLAAQVLGRTLNFTEDDLNRYIDQIIAVRVMYVNGQRVAITPTDNLAIPSFLSLVLSNLGLARDNTYGIELYPVLEQSVDIDPEFLRSMSRNVRILSHIGVEYADGYSRSRDGSYEFMSMTLVDSYVRTWTKDSHPVYALLASTVGLRGIEAVLSPRINYGSEEHMVSLVRHLAAVKG